MADATKRAPRSDEELARMEAIVGGELYEFVYLGRCYKLYRDGVEVKPIPLFPDFQAALENFRNVCCLANAEEVFRT